MKISNHELRELVAEACGCEAQGVSDDLAVDVHHDSEPRVMGHGGAARMARGHLFHIASRAQSLHDRLQDDDELPEWAQSKLAVAEAMVNAVFDHLDYKLHRDIHGEHDV